MATLSWIGRDAVVDHHERVESRTLREVPELACGDAASGNLIIQGDNLLALKALLPDYAGKVKCLYIDPPYNTGMDGWVYNDSVDSPAMREWLADVLAAHRSNRLELSDLDRRDRWLSMMYPPAAARETASQCRRPRRCLHRRPGSQRARCAARRNLRRKESSRLRPWLAEPSGGKEKPACAPAMSTCSSITTATIPIVSRDTRSTGTLNLQDRWGAYRKGRELTKWGGISLRSDRPGQWYPLRTPEGFEVWPIRNDGVEGHWRWGREHAMRSILEDPERAHWELRAFDVGVAWNGLRERWVPYEKIRDTSKPIGWSTWLDSHGINADATRELKDILGRKVFDTPKPVALIRWLVSLHTDDDALVVDTFAGSGTTGHAVLSLNHDDGGQRRFILIEMEPHIARDITTERIRRVANGYVNARGQPVQGLGGGFRLSRGCRAARYTAVTTMK